MKQTTATDTGPQGGTMDTPAIIILARQHRDEGSAPSARACLTDAVQQYDVGNEDAARRWALRSLAHSVGVFHADYRKADAPPRWYPRNATFEATAR